MANVTVIINGTKVEVPAGSTILDAANKINVHIPTLCYCPDVGCGTANKPASCRLCLVEATGIRGPRKILVPACATPLARDGVEVWTNSNRALKARRTVLELLLSDHPQTCLTCAKNQECELQKLAAEFGVREIPFRGEMNTFPVDKSAAIMRDLSKCVMCRRCETVCNKVQTVGALTGNGRGFGAKVGTASMIPLADSSCTFCGQCVNVCPVGAIVGVSYVKDVWKAINDPTKTVIVQTAPAVRVAIGAAYGLPAGENVLDKLVTALKIMGADEVYDTIFGADLTVREESAEFLRRLKTGENLPLMTSCCPAWVKYVENERPEFLKNLSTARSPMQMFASVLKENYRKKDAEDGRTTFHIAIMPCTAKKMEARREEFRDAYGVPYVDLVLTTQEVVQMMKESGIRFQMLEKESPDLPYGMGSGAAEIFGTSGGVAEAVIRCCTPDKSKNALRTIEHSGLRGTDAVRFAEVTINGRKVRAAIVHGLGSAAKLLDQIQSGEVQADLVEVMSCRTGCVGGAGQPYALMAKKLQRAQGLYEIDRSAMFKRSERNPVIDAMYANGLADRAHELLHIEYKD